MNTSDSRHTDVTLEENASKLVDSPTEKACVKERILEKIDFSKGTWYKVLLQTLELQLVE